jgi:hypothetical protein
MKILLLVDYKINEDQLKRMKAEVQSIYKKNGVNISFIDEWRDLSNVPKEWYDSSAEGIKRSYIADVTKEIYARYAKDVDQVVFLIHRDHWNLTGVWGWNMSRVFNGYGVQQCRFDNRNQANSVGTMYHELMHDHDSYVYVYTGKIIEDIIKVPNWDEDLVHAGKNTGTSFGWKYIRYNENQEALKAISAVLNEAIEARQKVWLKKKVSMLEQIVKLYQQLIVLRRQVEIQTRGDIPMYANRFKKCCGVPAVRSILRRF